MAEDESALSELSQLLTDTDASLSTSLTEILAVPLQELIEAELTGRIGDAVAVAALVDRLVHHAEVLVLRGDSYRLEDKSKDVLGTDPS